MIRNTRDDATAPTVSDGKTPTGTTAGAETTARMAGIHNTEDRPAGIHNTEDRSVGEHGSERTSERPTDNSREQHVETVRPTDRAHGVKPAKTSAAAAFGLVFGLAALFCALTAILAPAAVLFGLIGILVAAAGIKMAKRPGVTGRGVAIGGLVTAILGLLLGIAVIAGAAVVVNDEQRLNQIENQLEDLRADLPSASEIADEIPG